MSCWIGLTMGVRRIRGWSAILTEPGLLDRPVVLRTMRISDARAYSQVQAANESWLAKWDPFIHEKPLPHSKVERLVSKVRQTLVAPYAAAGFFRLQALLGSSICWTIWYDGQLAGQINVFRIEWGPLRSAEVGYWVDERLAGRGIVPAALAMAVDHCFLVLHLHRLEASIQPQNVASRRVMEKLGFREEGLRVGHLHVNGAWQDQICYAITADEVPGGLLSRWRSSVAPVRPTVPRPG